MVELPRRLSFSGLISAAQEPQIVLMALVRLRWLAVIGQIAATLAAVKGLGLHLPVPFIATVIALAAISNVGLTAGIRLGRPPGWLIQAVLLLDVCLLTSLLYLTGGPQNPFAVLYLVHVAMAVIVLGSGWTWAVVAVAAAGYAVLFCRHLPLGVVPAWAHAVGSWFALVLVAVLIAAFIGRVTRSLGQRELELATARQWAARNEQLAALTTLAAGAAHELNTPLATIAVVARELERSGGESSAAVLDDAQLIRREVDRCRGILSRMRLDIGEDSSQRGGVSVSQLLAELRENLSESERSRLRIIAPPAALGGPTAPRPIGQALLVLLRNAFDASAPQEPVTLEVTVKPAALRLEVRDRGCGMSEEMLRRAGEPFFTTKEPGKGMGLGLFLVRVVAERCGAIFSLDSQLAEGTRCVLEVPAHSLNNGR